MDKKITIDGKVYQIEKLLGHGKGGYSYLGYWNGKPYTIKQIHHEPCSYYTFGNKIEAEERDYHRLAKTGITIPKMIFIDYAREIIVKEYIEGPTIEELVKSNQMKECYIEQVMSMASLLKNQGLNIDYYPTNFIVMNDILYYVDYECNSYMEEWSFEVWGIQYWHKRLETERLVLRRFQDKDLMDLYAYLSDEEVLRFEPYPVKNIEETKDDLEWRKSTDEMLAVELKDSHKVIGNIYFGPRECDSFEIGYVFHKDYWHKGYATEAASKVMEDAFLHGAHRIYAMCDPKNSASWLLLERLGMQKEAHLHQNVYFWKDEKGNPIWKDTFIYAKLKQ